MSIEKFIDKQIEQAMARGEFDNLKGTGQPLNLDAYFATPEDVRIGYSILKSNDFVPEEVERLSEIAELKKNLEAAADAGDRERIRKRLAERSLELSLILERNKRKR
jgi:hypothetical protein